MDRKNSSPRGEALKTEMTQGKRTAQGRRSRARSGCRAARRSGAPATFLDAWDHAEGAVEVWEGRAGGVGRGSGPLGASLEDGPSLTGRAEVSVLTAGAAGRAAGGVAHLAELGSQVRGASLMEGSPSLALPSSLHRQGVI